MATLNNLEENEGDGFQGQFEEGEDYGLPQLDFSPLDSLDFIEVGTKEVPSRYSIDEETKTTVDYKESVSSPAVETEYKSSKVYQADGNQKLKFVFVVVLGVLFASIIGLGLFSMAEDPQVNEEVKKEVKKKIIPNPVIESELATDLPESENATDLPELENAKDLSEPENATDLKEPESVPIKESVQEPTGAISELTQPLNKYFLIVASFLDKDLAYDYADKLILSYSNVIIIPPTRNSKFTRVAIGKYETLENVIVEVNNYNDEFDEQLWVLKY